MAKRREPGQKEYNPLDDARGRLPIDVALLQVSPPDARGFVSLGVIASAAVVALGLQIADPIIGLIITIVILRITWDSWRTVRSAEIEIDYFEQRQ